MSHIHLLDTNALRAWIDGDHPRHANMVKNVGNWGDAFVFLSAVTVAEVEFGLARPHSLATQIVGKIRAALLRFPVLEIDRHVGEPYGKLRAWLVERYAPKGQRKKLRSLTQLTDPISDLALGIQENDLWLASQAIATEAVLVTGDRLERILEAARAADYELHCFRW